MPDIIPMSYKLFPLTIQESQNAKHWGWNFVFANKDRWVDADSTNYELQTYDRGISNVVYNNAVYHIERDFIDMDDNCRIFVGRRRQLNTDIIEDDQQNNSQNTDNTDDPSDEPEVDPNAEG